LPPISFFLNFHIQALASGLFFFFFVGKTALLRRAGQERHNTANNVVLDRNPNSTILSESNCYSPSISPLERSETDSALQSRNSAGTEITQYSEYGYTAKKRERKWATWKTSSSSI